MKRVVHRFAVLAGLSALVIGCAAPRPARLLDVAVDSEMDTSPVVASDERLRIRVLPYSALMERQVFGLNLHATKQMAVEISAERVAGRGKLVVRRHELPIVLDDGTMRPPVDPRKIYEEHRIDSTPALLIGSAAGGIIGGSLMASSANASDAERKAELFKLEWAQATLSDLEPVAGRFLFYDMTDIDPKRVVGLLVTYEDPDAAEDHQLRVTLELPQPTSDNRAAVPGREQRQRSWNP